MTEATVRHREKAGSIASQIGNTDDEAVDLIATALAEAEELKSAHFLGRPTDEWLIAERWIQECTDCGSLIDGVDRLESERNALRERCDGLKGRMDVALDGHEYWKHHADIWNRQNGLLAERLALAEKRVEAWEARWKRAYDYCAGFTGEGPDLANLQEIEEWHPIPTDVDLGA